MIHNTVHALPLSPRSRSFWAGASTYLELTKPRLTLLALLSTLLGFYLGSGQDVDFELLLNTLFASALVGAGANALNQFFEREADGKMKRTETRPLPSGRLTEEQAFNFGLVTSVVGVLHLAFFVNPLSSVLALLLLAVYLVFYTPLKRKTSLATFVGAVSGALPPVMGWAAAKGRLGSEPLVLFLILFLWQMPHFLAIAWLCRADYARAGFPFLAVTDRDGEKTARRIILYCLLLLPAALLPAVVGMAGPLYYLTALVLGLAFLGTGWLGRVWRPALYAKIVFISSIVYLSLIMTFMTADKMGPWR